MMITYRCPECGHKWLLQTVIHENGRVRLEVEEDKPEGKYCPYCGYEGVTSVIRKGMGINCAAYRMIGGG